LTDWAKGNAPPEIIKEVEVALATDRSKREFQSKFMMLMLKNG